MFWTISNSFESLAVLSVGSLYMVRLRNPSRGVGRGGGVNGNALHLLFHFAVSLKLL